MPIQVLSPQLANQIAAGEVVERPASVVKELIENSLDAGASRIDIDIERGGIKLIRIRDNGCGIKKEELALALARHATSKIACLDDLEAIVSLGFRGEALASISSVSRLTLTSRSAEQNEAWQAYAEGREMQVAVKPAAHPIGSTIEVLDLFYNTPARRKFLRTEKTEFSHIDEVVRRIALARFDASINLRHNGKLVRQYRAVKEAAQREKRLAAICGTLFMQHALEVSWQHGDLAIQGWIATPAGAKQVNDLQYCYVNGRIVRDRLITHAIRQAYQTELSSEEQPAYVLYLEVDPHQVDVNVHPAKHEVRFHQSRLVHDFIYQAVATALQKCKENSLDLDEAAQAAASPVGPDLTVENRLAAGKNSFTQRDYRSPNSPASTGNGAGGGQKNKTAWHESYLPPKTTTKNVAKETQLYGELIHGDGQVDEFVLLSDKMPADAPTPKPAKPALFPERKPAAFDISVVPTGKADDKVGKVLAIWRESYAIVEYGAGIGLLSLQNAENRLKAIQLQPLSGDLKSQPLLIPLRLVLSSAEKQGYINHQAILLRLGINIELNKEFAEVRGVPLPLRQQNLQALLPAMLNYLSQHSELTLEQLVDWLAEQLGGERGSWSQSQAIQVISELERLCPEALSASSTRLIQPIDLASALLALTHD